MRSFTAAALLALACCVRSAGAYLPTPGTYSVEHTPELAELSGRTSYRVAVVGDADRRSFVEAGPDGGCCERWWLLTDAGIVDERSYLLLTLYPVVGSRWKITRGEGICQNWSEIVAAGDGWLDVEETMYCGGEAHHDSIVMRRWQVGRGRVSEDYGVNGRATYRLLSTTDGGATP